MKRYIRSARHSEKDLDNVISWNSYYYGIKWMKNGRKYYKSQTPRFDTDPYNDTKEITEEEYDAAAEKYHRMFG